MELINIKSDIYFNKKKIVNMCIISKNKHIFYNEDNTEINRTDIKNITIKCSCGKSSIVKKITHIIITKNWICKSCRMKGENNPMFGKTHSVEIRKKISESNKGENNYMYGISLYDIFVEKYGKDIADEKWNTIKREKSKKYKGEGNPMYGISVHDKFVEKYGKDIADKKWEELNKSRSSKLKGENNPYYGKKHTEEIRNRISNSLKNSEKFQTSSRSKETRNKISKSLKNRVFSDEHLKNLRLSSIKNISNRKNNGIQISPNFNKDACEIFDNIMITENIFIQHAMNGGEFYIKELGYWVDGYDKENNTVYEFDERHHFNMNDELSTKDQKRQKEIENHLKCKFIRIKYNDII